MAEATGGILPRRASAGKTAWIINGCLLLVIFILLILALGVKSSLTRYGIFPPEAGEGRAGAPRRSGGVGGAGGRFSQDTTDKTCQQLYAAVGKYGVDMEFFYRASDKWGIPVNLLVAQAEQESNFNPTAGSPVGAQGVMQFMPDTWAGMEKDNPALSKNIRDPEASIYYGAKYLSQMQRMFSKYERQPYELALAAYNAGPGNVQKYGNTIPPFAETQNYVKNILSRAGKYKDCIDQAAAGGSIPPGSYSATQFIPGAQRPNIGTDFKNFRNMDLKQKDLSIIVKNTGAAPGSGIPGEYKGPNPTTISHFVVDGQTTYQLLPLDKASRSNAGENTKSFSIDMVYMDKNTKQGEVLNSTVDTVADLMARHRIPLSQVQFGAGQENSDYIREQLRKNKELEKLELLK